MKAKLNKRLTQGKDPSLKIYLKGWGRQRNGKINNSHEVTSLIENFHTYVVDGY